jgi:hypothetical protein
VRAEVVMQLEELDETADLGDDETGASVASAMSA